MKKFLFIVLSMAFPLMATPSKGVLPDGLPDGFDDLAALASDMCGEEQEAVLPKPGFTRPYDFNGDGVLDYLVESSLFRCLPEGNLIWGGTAGTAYLIYVSRPDGRFERAYAASGHAIQLVDMFADGRAMAVVVYRHGLYCGLSGVSSCVSAVIWDPVTQGFSRFGYDPAR